MTAANPPQDQLHNRTQLVAAAYVYLLRAGEVLLQQRRNTGYRDGHWAGVAGHVDPGESVLDAAVREVHEEVGVTLAAADLHPVTAMHRWTPQGGPVEQRIDMFFTATRWDGEPMVVEPHKAAAVRWFAFNDLPAPLVPHEGFVLQALLTGTQLPAVVVWETDLESAGVLQPGSHTVNR